MEHLCKVAIQQLLSDDENSSGHGTDDDDTKMEFEDNHETESVPILGTNPDIGVTAVVPVLPNHDIEDIPAVQTINAPWVQPFLASFDMVRDQHVADVRKF
jgi:hypothetical protein